MSDMQYGGKYIHLQQVLYTIGGGACSNSVTYLAQQLSTKVIVHDPCINPAAIILQKIKTSTLSKKMHRTRSMHFFSNSDEGLYPSMHASHVPELSLPPILKYFKFLFWPN